MLRKPVTSAPESAFIVSRGLNAALGSASPGLLVRCDFVPADQRRTIGVVARGLIEKAATTPMARRRPASLPEQQTASRVPGEPGWTLCWRRHKAWWSIRHNVEPGTPLEVMSVMS